MTGAGAFVALFLRRDRWLLLWWSLAAVLLYWSQAVSVDGLYATRAEFERAAASMGGNPALVAMAGPARALDTVGGQVTWQSTASGAILVGLMSMFLVGRHTRAEEESGRDELLRAGAVARESTMTATLLVALLGNVALGALVAASLIAYPLAVADSLALGFGLTLVGWVFTGVSLVAAQLTASTRAMYGWVGVAIGTAYGLRAVGDVGNPALSWLSPIGWYQAMHAFSGLRWWPAAPALLATAGTVVTAYAVFRRRDFGSGLLPDRPGPADAGPMLGGGLGGALAGGLGGGLGLAFRLQRPSVAGWAAGLFVTGLAYGSLGDGVGDLLGDSQASRDLMVQVEGDLVAGFYATAVLVLALLAAGFAVASALRPAAEEEDGRVEQLLATALPRDRWLLGHAAVTAVGTIAVLLAGGLGLGVGYALATGAGEAVGRYPVASLGYAAPVLLLAALAWLLTGLAPRFARLAWVWLAVSIVVMVFGELLRFPRAVRDLSPFEHLALAPAEPFRAAPVLVLLAIGAAVTAAASAALTRRDIR